VTTRGFVNATRETSALVSQNAGSSLFHSFFLSLSARKQLESPCVRLQTLSRWKSSERPLTSSPHLGGAAGLPPQQTNMSFPDRPATFRRKTGTSFWPTGRLRVLGLPLLLLLWANGQVNLLQPVSSVSATFTLRNLAASFLMAIN